MKSNKYRVNYIQSYISIPINTQPIGKFTNHIDKTRYWKCHQYKYFPSAVKKFLHNLNVNLGQASAQVVKKGRVNVIKECPLMFWHTKCSLVCSKMINHGLNHGLFSLPFIFWGVKMPSKLIKQVCQKPALFYLPK